MTAAQACPVCGNAPAARFRPFCSARCADVDLGRWLTEQYRLPASPDEQEEAGEQRPASDGAPPA
jgi:endogenous inhibitor of DNA gyrase (YacG/DUF329 family)